MDKSICVICLTVNSIYDFLFYTYNYDINNYLQNLIHYCFWPIGNLTKELLLFKQVHINLAHLSSNLKTSGNDELIDGNKLQRMAFL